MRETIAAALKDATKSQDKRRMSTLRLVSAAIKDRDIAARTAGKPQATDAELLELFAKMIKQREESQKIYADAGRAELAKQESEPPGQTGHRAPGKSRRPSEGPSGA